MGPRWALALGLLTASFSAWSYVPLAEVRLDTDPECRSEVLEETILHHSAEPNTHENYYRNYFDHCRKQLLQSNLPWFVTYIKHRLREYDFYRNPQIQRVDFVDGDIHVEGALALKPGPETYPLVLFQCGVTCDLGDPSTRQFMILLFDQAPFHVLLLPSSTGSQFQMRNGVLAMGGFDEGRRLVKIARWIRSPEFPWASRVSRVHLMGASLGGHSALFASLYADLAKDNASRREPTFTSVIAACPVVDLEPAIKNVTTRSLVGAFFYRVFLGQLFEVIEKVPILKELIPDQKKFAPKLIQLREVMAAGATDYYRQHTPLPLWNMAPFEEVRVENEQQFYYWNRFQDVALPRLKSPVFVWAARNDDIVKYEDNTARLVNEIERLQTRKIQLLETPQGGHCAYQEAYGFQATAAVFRSYFLARSPELLARRQIITKAVPGNRIPKRWQADRRLPRNSYSWIAAAGSKTILWRSVYRDRCPGGSTRGGGEICDVPNDIKFEMSELGLDAARWIPRNEQEAESLGRWLNSQLHLINQTGRPITPVEDPVFFQLTSYLKP